ncbi:hypothetical protein F5Y15DRAFT_212856 [Xylariaceae sp. FL0016]|nr:hypothetical protein F5Y15DRAFT_212856 [Xylariaceae sp. FL0016]
MPMSPVGSLSRVQLESLASSPGQLPPSLDDDCFSTDDDLDLPSSHENPLTYFLTPATPKDEEMEFDFDFDAGIEDSNNPRDIIRSISPSTLDGLKSYKPRRKRSDCAVLDEDDDDDDDEDYIRFQPKKSLPFGFEKYFDHPRHAYPTDVSRTTEALLSPTAFHVGSPRGRATKRFAPSRRNIRRGRPQVQALQRRHSWREPSPDVWAIEEEPEKETMSELGLSMEDLVIGEEGKTRPIDIPAAKPKKKVRFIIPVKE